MVLFCEVINKSAVVCVHPVTVHQCHRVTEKVGKFASGNNSVACLRQMNMAPIVGHYNLVKHFEEETL